MAKEETNKKPSTKGAVKKKTTKEVKTKVSTKTPTKKDPSKKETQEEKVKKVSKKVNDTKPRKVKTVDIAVVDKKIKTELTKANELKKEKSISEKKEDNLSFSLFEVILLIIITILSCILIGEYLKPKTEEQKKPEVAEEIKDIEDKYIKQIVDQYNYIMENYYGNIDKNLMIKNAISGMLSSLDNYSEMIDEESNTFSITLQGEYEGLGVVIANDENYNIIIQQVYEDTPASRAGLQAGDVIIKINDKLLQGVTSSDFVNLVKSYGNVSLTVLRNGEEINTNMKIEKIILKSVRYEMLDNKVGYIDVDVFAANTYEQFKSALEDLEKQGMQSLIIDLRDNTGGHLTAVENMLSLFFDKKHVIYQTQDNNGVEKVHSNGNKNRNYKIVILQNGNSASASEIMSSALSEEANAYIIGTRSFGKGTVQQLNDLNGIGQYKFTVKRWLTPSGTWIDGTGVKPDLEVNNSSEYFSNPIRENDEQFKSAVEYLK